MSTEIKFIEPITGESPIVDRSELEPQSKKAKRKERARAVAAKIAAGELAPSPIPPPAQISRRRD